MSKTRQDIAQELLRTANYYWHDENEENVNPLNPDDYDPVIDKLFKAVALEMEKLYAELDESRQEVVLNLARSLVPDQTLLPEPGYTVAQLYPKGSRLNTSPEDHYLLSGQSATSEQYEYYFTPIMKHAFPKCLLRAIVTDSLAVEVDNDRPEVVHRANHATATGVAWFAFEIEHLEIGDLIPFFIGNQITDEFDKNSHAINTAKWSVNGNPALAIEATSGIDALRQANASTDSVLSAIRTNEKVYEQQLLSRFRHSFLSLRFPFDTSSHVYHFPQAIQASTAAQALTIKDSLLWLRAEFIMPVDNQYLLENMLYPNCIPFINRRMLKEVVVKKGFDRILMPLPTTDLFLGIHRVQDTVDREQDTAYREVDFLYPEDGAGSYMLRGGERVRRLNREDVTDQINRLLEVIQEEYQTFKEEGVNRLRADFDLIDKAVNRIKQQLPSFFRRDEQRSTYVGLAHFRPQVSRLEYTYWETQGDALNQLGHKVGLAISSDAVKLGVGRTVIPIQKGKGQMTKDEYLSHLKMTLLSRGRIMTKADISRYVHTYYGRLLQVKDISRALMILVSGERGRGILVKARTREAVKPAEAENLRLELQNDLNAKSAFFTQIKVEIDD